MNSESSKRLIEVPEDLKFVAIREEYLAICGGEPCPAALLNLFERFSFWKEEQGYSDAEWVYMKQPEVAAALLNVWGLTWVRRWLKWLEAVGFLERRRDPKHRMDATPQYRFDADAVQAAVTNTFVTEWQIDSSESDECIYQDVTNAAVSFWRMHYSESDVWTRQPVTDAFVTEWQMILLDSFLDFLLRFVSQSPPSSSPEAAPAGVEPHPLWKLADPDDDDAGSRPFAPAENSEPEKPEPTVWALYAENIEPLTPALRDRLVDAISDYGEAALRAAINQAVDHNVRKWKYVQACLEGRPKPVKAAKNGRDRPAQTSLGPEAANGQAYVSGKYADFIEH